MAGGLAACIAALVLTAVPVAAVVDPVESPPVAELPAGLGCEFPLTIESSDANRHLKETAGGLVIVAGQGFTLTYTNEKTQESVTIRTGGSVQRTITNGDIQTVTATGHNGLVLFPSDVPAGPSTIHYVGRLVYTVNTATGVFTVLSSAGTQRDICAELSA